MVSASRTGLSAAVILLPVVATVLLLAQSQAAAWAAVAAGVYCVCLATVPTFWLAVLLIVLIPFHNLLTQLLGGFGQTTRQAFATWKEILVLVGLIRVVWNNPRRRQIVAANRWILFWTGVLIFTYCVAFLRAPSVPAFLALNLETRFLGVMLFFMFLDLGEERIATLLRLMVWSVGLVAIYGIIQFFWDYERLLPLVNREVIPFEGTRRLYSFTLSFFEAAYGATTAILILIAGAARSSTGAILGWLAILVPCLILTYTRSAYLGLLVGIIVLCAMDRILLRRTAVLAVLAVGVLCGILVFNPDAAARSDIGQRIQSIVAQKDESSQEHHLRMQTALRVVNANPFGVGLGRFGPFSGMFAGFDRARYTENWPLQIAAGTGVIGALAFLGLTGTLLWSLYGSQRRGNTEEATSRTAATVSIFAAMTVASMMIPVWDSHIPAVYVWSLTGMALATSSRSRDDEARRSTFTRTPANETAWHRRIEDGYDL